MSLFSRLRAVVSGDDYLDGDEALYEIADKIAASGKSGLTAVGQNNGVAMADPVVLSGLEVIVRTDGTRPSFMIRNGVPETCSFLAECRSADHDKAVKLAEEMTSTLRREIEAALSGPLPARDLGGLKRRTRAGMGRCQGFYCGAEIAALTAGRLAEPLAVGPAHG